MIRWRKLALVSVSVYGWLIVGYLGVGERWANAQSMRDPTVPPAEVGVVSAEASRPDSMLFDTGAWAIVVREGKAYVVIGTRFYTSGQQLGSARIERISESEIWLRESGVLRKVPHYAGVVRRSAQDCGNSEVAGPRSGPTEGRTAVSKPTDPFKPQNARIPCIRVQSRSPTQ